MNPLPLRKNPVSAGFAQKVLRRQKIKAEWAAELKRVARHFRPRKAERGTVIFLAVRPKGGAVRLSNKSKRQAYPFYVTTKGKLEPVKEYKQKKSQAPALKVKPWRFDPVGLVAGKRKRTPKRAERKLRAQYIPAAPLVIIPKRKAKVKRRAFWNEQQGIYPDDGQQVTWDMVAEKVGTAMERAFGGDLAEEKQLFVHFNILVETADGRQETWDDRIFFAQSQYQELVNAGWYDSFIQRKCYAFFADHLKNAGYMTLGSYNYIRKLPQNRGKRQADWTDSKQMEWAKSNIPLANAVIIQRVTFQLERVHVTSKQID